MWKDNFKISKVIGVGFGSSLDVNLKQISGTIFTNSASFSGTTSVNTFGNVYRFKNIVTKHNDNEFNVNTSNDTIEEHFIAKHNLNESSIYLGVISHVTFMVTIGYKYGAKVQADAYLNISAQVLVNDSSVGLIGHTHRGRDSNFVTKCTGDLRYVNYSRGDAYQGTDGQAWTHAIYTVSLPSYSPTTIKIAGLSLESSGVTWVSPALYLDSIKVTRVSGSVNSGSNNVAFFYEE